MLIKKQSEAISMRCGSPDEIRAVCEASPAGRLLLFEFDSNHLSDDAVQALVVNLATLVFAMGETLQKGRDREWLELLAGELVPRLPPPARVIREAAMLVRARAAVLECGDWLTSAQIAQLAGLSTRNPSAQPNKWKKQGLIFAIGHRGTDYFPAYGLDPDTGFRPLKSLAPIIKIFEGYKDGWGMAYWFLATNSFLGDRRPRDVLASDPASVLKAAEDEVQGVIHG